METGAYRRVPRVKRTSLESNDAPPIVPSPDLAALQRDDLAYAAIEVLRARGPATVDEVKADLVERCALTAEQQDSRLLSGANRLDHLLSLAWQDLEAAGAVNEPAGPARSLTTFGESVSSEALRDACAKSRRERREQAVRDFDDRMALEGVLRVCGNRSAAIQQQRWFSARLAQAGYSVDVQPVVNTYVRADGTVAEQTSFRVVSGLRCTAQEQRELIRTLDEQLSLAARREEEAQDRMAQRRQRRKELQPFLVKACGAAILAALMLFSLISLRNEEPASPPPPGFAPEPFPEPDICFGPWGTEDC